MYWYLCVHFQYVPNECLSNLCRRICCLKCGSPRTYCLSDVMPGCKIHLSSKPSEDRICRWNQPEGIRLLMHILTLDSTCNSSNLRSWDHTLVLLTIYLSWTRSYAGLTDVRHMDVAHWLVPCEEKYKMESAGEALAESFSVSNDFFNSCLLPRCFLTFLRNLWAHFMTWKLVKRTTWLGLQRAGALGSLFVISRYCTLSCRYFQRQLVFLLVVASH